MGHRQKFQSPKARAVPPYHSLVDTLAYHHEKDGDLPLCALGRDPDALLVGTVTLHLRPEVCVQQHTVAT